MRAQGPPPGWYRDPAGSGGWRWWDGSAWTAHVAPPTGPPAWAVPQLVAAEQRMAGWALASVIVLGVLAAVDFGLFVGAVPQLRAIGHWWQQLVDNAGTPGYVAPPPPNFAGGWILGIDGLGLVSIPAYVLFLVWQYRAAQAARAAGYPAARSPGWGVGSWFVPVVNLWMPFGALRDCLPPGTPHRNRVWLVLAFGAAGFVLAEAGFFTAVFASSGGTPLLVVGGLLELGAYAALGDVVRRVSAAHRALVAGTPGG